MTNSNHNKVDNAFKHIVEQKTTQELLNICLNEYLGYQEEFIDACETELKRRKIDTGIKENYYTLLPEDEVAEFIINRLKQGMSAHDCIRILQHNHMITNHSEDVVQKAIDKYTKEKWGELINKSIVEMIAGAVLFAIGVGRNVYFPKISVWLLDWLMCVGIMILLIGMVKFVFFVIKRTIKFVL